MVLVLDTSKATSLAKATSSLASRRSIRIDSLLRTLRPSQSSSLRSSRLALSHLLVIRLSSASDDWTWTMPPGRILSRRSLGGEATGAAMTTEDLRGGDVAPSSMAVIRLVVRFSSCGDGVSYEQSERPGSTRRFTASLTSFVGVAL